MLTFNFESKKDFHQKQLNGFIQNEIYDYFKEFE